MKPLRVGLLGAGYILKSHATALSRLSSVTVQSVCDASRGRAAAAAADFGIPEIYGSIDELAASECDVVHVLLPPALHVAAARTLLEAGKHVFIEKPMGLSAVECDELATLAEQRRLSLGVNHNFLFAPGYQPVRDAVRSGRLGAIDHLSLDWLYALPLLQFGPFNNWMLASPENLVFELGPHLAAFAVDLLGSPSIDVALAANPIDLPGSQRVWRRWSAIGSAERAGLSITLSVASGQAQRGIAVRGTGGTAHFDLERGIAWEARKTSDNPIVDNMRAGRSTARQIGRAAGRDFRRYLSRTFRKQAGADPFEESIAESVAAFYRGLGGTVDERLTGRFGANVIRLCEAIVERAGVSRGPVQYVPARPLPAAQPPRVLVVGGTGFIGRKLVQRLVDQGVGVRVLTRSLGSASIDLAGIPVDLVQGSHADRATLDRALDGIDTVYHLAKSEGRRWQHYVDDDIEPTRTLAEAALAHGVRRFIYTGTIDSYASAKASDTITGDTPLDPRIATRNLYARSKATCEALLKEMAAARGLPLVIFRPGIVIGAGSPPAHLGVAHFVSATRADYWGDGTNKLPLVLVDDVAAALALALDAPGIDGETFLLTDAPLMSARDYVAAVQARSGTSIDAKARPAWRYWAADALKEGAKNAIRHPNRRIPSYHDWDCRSHRARYDSRKTMEMLGWSPAADAEALIRDGIDVAVDRFMR